VASTNISNEYAVYISQCIALAQTIVVKSEESVQGLNQYVTDYFGASAVDETDPSSWKYYMNISGRYHFSDTVMQVTSLDTMEVIDFTVDNLAIHTATAAAYQFGTRLYRALIAQYPAQVSLILGIIYPVHIDAAIAAKDGQILGWPIGYVQSNEYSLVERLQRWIYGFKARWVNPQYAISDELYPMVQHANMYYGLLMAIIAFRLEACGTAEAHSFHVQQYLGSHLGLDQFLDQLSLSQAIWFYRNINYIERNVGKQSTFQTLIDKLLTERNIPLAAYQMKHDLSQMPNALYPTITFEATPLNLGYNLVPDTTWSLDEMLDNEQPVASANAKIQVDVEGDILEQMQNSLSNRLQTKVLNSAMIDQANSTPYTLEDALMNHWLFFSSIDWYTAFIVVDNPVTGEPIVPMNAKDGYVFMWYCFCMSVGIDLTQKPVPAAFAKRVQRIPTPSVADLMSVVDTSLVTQDIAERALSWQPVIQPMISTDAFYATAKAIWTAANNQRNLVALQEHAVRRGMVYGMVEQIYSDNIIQMGDNPGETYYEWFRLRNIDTSTFAAGDYGLMYLSLVQAATGLSLLSTNSLANLQKAMISMMQRLSSYSVQFLSEINDSAIQDVDWPMVRVGDVDMSGSIKQYDPNTTADVVEEAASGAMSLSYDVNAATADFLFESCVIDKLDCVPVDSWPAHDELVINKNFRAMDIHITPVVPLEPNDRGIQPVIGLDSWLTLSDAQQLESLVSIYSPNYNTASAPLQQMATVWPVRNLSGLVYTPPA
jgi:hypothetical protein